MQRLPGVDAGFLYMETPTLHMHTLKVAVLDVSEVPGGYSFERLRTELGDRLHLLPPFRQRVVPVPLRFNHPVVVEDAGFDLSRHVRLTRARPPGGMAELDEVVGAVASTPLDRDRPLWELWVVEGLADGRVGVVAKIHHALADGLAAAALLANVMGTGAEPMHVPADRWAPEPMPTRWTLLADALRDWLRDLRALPALLVRTARGVTEVVRRRRRAVVPPPRPVVDAGRMSFNGALTARRAFTTASLPLADFKRVRSALDAPLTDVVLCVVGGAVRRWADKRGEPMAGSLLAAVPVAVDPAGADRLVGNRVSSLITSLCTDIADPVARLRAVQAVTASAREMQEALGLDLMERWVQYTPPGPFAGFMRLYSRLRAANLHRPPVNMVVSNVPGPRSPLYVGGARLVDLYSVGPILEGIGLNVTVWSYLDRLSFAALACPDLVADLRDLADGFAEALADLVAALPSSP